MSSSTRSTHASLAAHAKWAGTKDRTAATQAARDAQRRRYLEQARELQGPDATTQAVEIAADHLFRADQKRRSLKAARARRLKAEARRASQGRQSSDDSDAA